MASTEPQTALEHSQHAEILELESQIRSLNTKISAAVDHAADLQDEVRTMRARQREDLAAQEALANESGLRRMSTYFSRRTATPPPSSAPAVPSFPRSLSMSPSKSPRKDEEENARDDLFAQLAKERRMRKDLELRYRTLQQESEDLSQTLFEEANKMVSTEKKLTHEAQTKLNVVQDREVQRRQRLDELEAALETIQRVRGVLAAPVFVHH